MDCFTRAKRGTDVIIVGFIESVNWVENIKKAVLKNFFIAISEGRLIVELKDGNKAHLINSDTLSQIFADLADDREMVATVQLYKAFTTPDCKELLEVLEPDDVEVYIKCDSSYKRTIANFRATGMLVGTYFRKILQHYATVVIVRGQKLGELLKDTEPPRHNRWDYKQIEPSDKEKRKSARNSIQCIENLVLELLKKQFEVPIEDTVDAAGVGEYIPDDIEGLGSNAEGDDVLKAKIKIGKVNTNRTRHGSIIKSAVKEKGTEEEGDVRNYSRNPNPMPPKLLPHKPVSPYPDAPDSQPGATPGNGAKTVKIPNLTVQRAFPISFSKGIYKIVIKPAERYENLYVECFAVGEDDSPDVLKMESFTYNGKNIGFDKGKAGPIEIDAGIAAMFFVKFEKKEKMKLRLHLTEVLEK